MSADARWACPPQTILVGVDFGDASARALTLAGLLAREFGASLRAVHAERFEPPPYFTMEQIVRLEADRQASHDAAVQHLSAVGSAAAGRPVAATVVDEPPVDAILHSAQGVDMIVLGTHGRRGPGRWWLGSVAERVVRAAAVPVLVTRASASPLAEVFKYMTLVHDGPESDVARACARSLAAIAGGEVVDGGSAGNCSAGIIRQASLVVVARGVERPSWGLSDPAARVLTACDAPILFIPARTNGEVP
jgi:nucleotide-binding universal stress UspA family protein